MMRFLMKCLMNGIIVIPLLMWLSEATFFGALLTAVILCAIAYYAGDQMVLRMSNNAVATIADVLLTFVYLWLVSLVTGWSLTFGELLLITTAVAVVEVIFHRQLGVWDRRVRA